MSGQRELFEQDRHRAVSATPWNEVRAREKIRSLLDAVLGARMDSGLWPFEEEFPLILYAGVAWAADKLSCR